MIPSRESPQKSFLQPHLEMRTLLATTVEGTGSINLDLDSQASSSLFHYTPWALRSDLVY